MLPTIDVPALHAAPNLNGRIDASWSGAARLRLTWDYHYRRPAEEQTTVYLAQYGGSIYLAFDARQREAITASQHTDGPGVESDDDISAHFYPQGTQGFDYTFVSNPLGTHDQSSSENSSYSPQWVSVGRVSHHGYVITERIPLAVIRFAGSHSWRAQFTRTIVATGAQDVWTYNPAEQYHADVNYAGTLTGIAQNSKPVLPPARIQLYGLGEIASPAAGGSTSRIGSDLSIPITPTTSFIATLHPDYSNVEIDQQTISPQEFARQYQEVRPFFTQAASPFNGHFSCSASGCFPTFYTPSVPEFSQGYAIEGAQGPLTFGALDAIGSQRSDAAQVVNYLHQSPRDMAQVSLQRVAVDFSGVHDDTTTLEGGYSFAHNHDGFYLNGGTDRGSLVTDAAQGNYLEYGAFISNATASLNVGAIRLGSQFNPVDGYIAHPDIAGWSAQGHDHIEFSQNALVRQIHFFAEIDRYNDHTGRPDQSDQTAGVDVSMKGLLSAFLSTGSSYLLTPDGVYRPFNQNSATIGYRGGTTTPTILSYNFGRYYAGSLTGWTRLTTLPVLRELVLSLEDDNTVYVPDDPAQPVATQWLERATFDWQLSRAASFDLGVRRIIGANAPAGFAVYSPSFVDASNVTAAFHFLALRNEFYVVYGDPNSVSTTPALFVKWIRYIGAPKGT